MARVYATAADVWPTDPPANAGPLLRAASRVVDVLLIGRVYDVDAAGMPTAADDIEALRDATGAIALEAAASGVLAAGGASEWASVGIGSVSLSGRKTVDGVPTIAGLSVPPLALVYLSDVGTMAVTVWA